MPEKRFSIMDRVPETGQFKEPVVIHVHDQAVGPCFAFLLRIDPGKLAFYAVVDKHGRSQDAESWMEARPADHVVHVFASAHANVRGALETLWPELHLALTSLEANHGQS